MDVAAEPIDIITQMITGGFALSIFVTGLFFHSKVVCVSKKDRDVTWQLDMTNSVILVFHYGHVMIMYGVTFLIKDLYTYTGIWFCYASKTITLLGNAHSTGHSFVISVMKYVIIVQYEKVLKFGREKVQRIFFWLNIFYPIYVIITFNILRPDFLLVHDGISQANRCLGKPDLVSSQNISRPAAKLHDMCITIVVPSYKVSVEYCIYLMRAFICWIHIVFLYCNVWNVIEFFIYYVIFKFMYR